MAVAFDAVGPNSSGASRAVGSGLLTLSWSHTCSGSNRLVVAGVVVGGANATITTTTTYNGVSMTSAGKVFSENLTDGYIELFYLVAPPTGANTVQVTINSDRDLNCGTVSFTGVDQVTPVSNITSAFGHSTAPSVNVTSAVGNMVVDAVGTGSGTSSSNQTLRWLANISGASASSNGAQSTAAGASSVTMSYVAANDAWGIMAMNINAAAVASGVTAAWLAS